MYTSESKESIKVLDNFIQKEKCLELNQDLKTNLIENLSQSDFCKEVRNQLISKKHFLMKLKME